MFAIERVRIIKNHLSKDQKVSVAKLSELLNVTEVTIRRDLEKLEKDGYIKRIHGGAVLYTSYTEDIYSLKNNPLNIEQLTDDIATTAFHLVSDSDTIMMTCGDTNLAIARKLSLHNKLTVVTNDVRIALHFTNSPTNQLILLGGDLDQFGTFGQMTIDALHHFSFKHLFIEIDGISKNGDLTVSSVKKATLIQQALKLSEEVTIICPSHFFGEKALFRIGSIDMAHKILTDYKLSPYYKQLIYNHNIPLYTSIELYEG